MSTQTAAAETLAGVNATEGQEVTVQVGPKANLAVDGTLPPGTSWRMADRTWTISQNHEYILIAQDDGNLVLYQVIGNPPNPPERQSFNGVKVRATDTHFSNNKGHHVIFQTDGNLVIYKSAEENDSTMVWKSHTQGIDPISLVVENAGYVAIYKKVEAWRW